MGAVELDGVETGLFHAAGGGGEGRHQPPCLVAGHGAMGPGVAFDLRRRYRDAVLLAQQTEVEAAVRYLDSDARAVIVGGLRKASHSGDVTVVGYPVLATGGLAFVRDVGVAGHDQADAAPGQRFDDADGVAGDLAVVGGGAVPGG